MRSVRRVTPSEVVKLIDAVLPGARIQAGERSNLEFDSSYMGPLSAVLAAVEEVPQHLLTMPDTEYYAYITAIDSIRTIIPEWQARGAGKTLKKVPNVGDGLNPVTLIRQALDKCPDDLPSPQSHQLGFLGDPALQTGLQADIGIIERALANSEWKTATVMAGSAIEAILLWALEQKDARQVGLSLTTANKLKLSLRGPTLPQWELHPYVEVAAHLGIIQGDTRTETALAKNYRNLIHPGRAIRLQQHCDRGTAFTAVAALDHVVRDIERWCAAGLP